MTKNTVRKTTSVHEKTVQEAHVHAAKHARKRPRAKAGNKNTRITTIKVDERVMKTAKQLAKGDASRIKIIDATTVIVANPKMKVS